MTKRRQGRVLRRWLSREVFGLRMDVPQRRFPFLLRGMATQGESPGRVEASFRQFRRSSHKPRERLAALMYERIIQQRERLRRDDRHVAPSTRKRRVAEVERGQ